MLTKRHPDWRLDEEQRAAMQDIVSQRVMAMTRQVGTTATRPKKPTRFNQLFERDDVMTTAAVVLLETLPTIADDGLETESATAFGRNAETGERGKAWRCPTTSPNAKEYTDQFTLGTSALYPVVATLQLSTLRTLHNLRLLQYGHRPSAHKDPRNERMVMVVRHTRSLGRCEEIARVRAARPEMVMVLCREPGEAAE